MAEIADVGQGGQTRPARSPAMFRKAHEQSSAAARRRVRTFDRTHSAGGTTTVEHTRWLTAGVTPKHPTIPVEPGYHPRTNRTTGGLVVSVRVLERRTLSEVTSGDGSPHAASDLAFARIAHDYPSELLDAVHTRSRQLRDAAQPKERTFLGLDHLRRVQDTIPEVGELVRDRDRLDRLSEVAGVELEPYPIGTSCSGVNFY